MNFSSTRFNQAFGQVLLALSFALVVCASIFEIRSPDLFWHLRMGLDFIEKGLSPFVDHYSFTMPGAPIHDLGFLFQVLIAGFYKIFGLTGVSVYRLFAFGSGLILLVLLFKKQNISNSIKTLAVAFYLYFIIYRNEPRPELLSLSLELLTILIMTSWRDEKDIKKKWRLTAVMALLLLVWTNFHLSSIFGFVIVGAFIAEQALVSRQIKFLVLPTLILMGVGFLNHDFAHPFLAQSHLSSRWAEYITEYDVRSFSGFEFQIKLYSILVACALPALIILRRYAGVLLILVLGFKLFSLYKLFPHFGIVALPWLSEGFQYYLSALKKKPKAFYSHGFSLASFGVGLVVFATDINMTIINPLHPKNGGLDHNYYPLDATLYLKKMGITGRIFNQYALGSFLIFSNAPEISVYIDGRTSILYPIEFFDHYFAAQINATKFIQEIEKYNIHYVLAGTERTGEILDTALASGRFKIDYFGSTTAVLTDGEANFTDVSKIFARPRCLNEKQNKAFEKELETANSLLPPNSPLSQFMGLLQMYFETKNKADLFRAPHNEWTTSSYVSRLASELAGRNNQPEAQLFYLNSIKSPGASDRLARAILLCQLAHCTNAEDEIAKGTKFHMSDSELYQVWHLLEKISQVAALNETSNKIRKNIEARIGPLLASPKAPADTTCMVSGR